MPKSLLRIVVGLFLVPCLIVDPIFAFALAGVSTARAMTITSRSFFNEEAIIPVICRYPSSIDPAEGIREATREQQQIDGFRRAKPEALGLLMTTLREHLPLWPTLKFLLPLVMAGILWPTSHSVLARAELTSPRSSNVFQEAFLNDSFLYALLGLIALAELKNVITGVHKIVSSFSSLRRLSSAVRARLSVIGEFASTWYNESSPPSTILPFHPKILWTTLGLHVIFLSFLIGAPRVLAGVFLVGLLVPIYRIYTLAEPFLDSVRKRIKIHWPASLIFTLIVFLVTPIGQDSITKVLDRLPSDWELPKICRRLIGGTPEETPKDLRKRSMPLYLGPYPGVDDPNGLKLPSDLVRKVDSSILWTAWIEYYTEGKPGNLVFGKTPPDSSLAEHVVYGGNTPFGYPGRAFGSFRKGETGQAFKPVLELSHYDTIRILIPDADPGALLVRLGGGTSGTFKRFDQTYQLVKGPQEIRIDIDPQLVQTLDDRLAFIGFFFGAEQGNAHALRIEIDSVIPVVKESYRKTSPPFPQSRDPLPRLKQQGIHLLPSAA